MARYFFHVRDGNTLLKDDEESQEFPNLEAVRLEALQAAREILSEAALSGHAGSLNQHIEVVDEAGRDGCDHAGWLRYRHRKSNLKPPTIALHSGARLAQRSWLVQIAPTPNDRHPTSKAFVSK